jgi:hypothetical protein
MIGEEWYDSSQFKVLRMINNKISGIKQDLQQIADLLETLKTLYPGANLDVYWTAIQPHFTEILKSQDDMLQQFYRLDRELSPRLPSEQSGKSFAKSEIIPHPNMLK